jgi:type IV secretion system protein TrbC
MYPIRLQPNPSPAKPSRRTLRLRPVFPVAALLLLSASVFAQSTGTSPWENAVNVLKTAFTGPIATGLSLVAIVVGGLMFAYGEGQSKRMLAGIVFGVGMAIGAVNFMAWLFP